MNHMPAEWESDTLWSGMETHCGMGIRYNMEWESDKIWNGNQIHYGMGIRHWNGNQTQMGIRHRNGMETGMKE